MKNSLRSLALVAGFVVAAAGRANAQFLWSGCGGSGGPGFNTCASVNITWSGSVLTMVVQNWGTYTPVTGPFATLAGSSVFTALGIKNFGGTLTSLVGSANCTGGSQTDPTCSWAYGTNLGGAPPNQALNSLNNFGGTFYGAAATPPPSSNGLDPPTTSGAGNYTQVVLVFNTTGTIDFTQASFALHGQVGPNGCSTKLQVTNNNGSYTYNSTTAANACVGGFNPPTETPIPEPASMILLATGLVAIGGVGYLRRRNQKA